MALPPFQQNSMQNNARQRKGKFEEELGKPMFQAQGLTNQQPQVPAFQTPKKVEAPKDLQPPKTLQPAAPITATPQAQPAPLLQTPKAVLEAPKTAFTPMQPPAMPTLPELRPPAMAPPMMERPMPLAPKPSDINLGNILGPLIQPTEVPNKPLAPALQEMLKPVGERPPLLQPQAPTFSPSAQLPELPPRPQAGGLPPRPDLGGILNPMLQREPIPKNEGLVPSDAVREALRPNLQDMLKPVTIATGTAPDTSNEISPGATGSSGASRFINFDRILAANAPTSTGMSQKALSEIEKQGGKAEQSLEKAKQAFGEKITQGTKTYGGEGVTPAELPRIPDKLVYDPYAKEENQLTGVKKSEGLQGVPQQGDTFIPESGTNISLEEAKKRGQETYSGPSANEFFGSPESTEARKAIQEASEITKAVESQEGLEAFLNKLYGTSGGTGSSRLDAALARVKGGQNFDVARKRFGNLNQLLSDYEKQAAEKIMQAQQTSNETAAKYTKLAQDQEEEDRKALEERQALIDSILKQNEYETWRSTDLPDVTGSTFGSGEPDSVAVIRQDLTGSTDEEPKSTSKFTTQGTGNQILVGPYPDGSYRDESGRRVDANGNPI